MRYKLKIIKCSHKNAWYKTLIGEEFNYSLSLSNDMEYCVLMGRSIGNVDANDVELLTQIT